MSSAAIKQKRLKSEIGMLEKLPEGYLVSYQKLDKVIKIYIEIDK